MAKLEFKVIPKASEDAIVGVRKNKDGKPVINVKLRAVPEKGKANKSLVKMLASLMGISPSMIDIVKGETSKNKLIEIDMDEEKLANWLKEL